MGAKTRLFLTIIAVTLICVTPCLSNQSREGRPEVRRGIVASDTLLSGMITSLLPPNRYTIEAILPPGQCPGHYDVKLSDIEKMKKADLIVSFRGMPFMDKAGPGARAHLLVDSGGRNWMAPDTYVNGLGILAGVLSTRFPVDQGEIMVQMKGTVREVKDKADALLKRLRQAGFSGKTVIASTMQKEPLEWMGFRVVGEYGRPEAMSARDVARLSKIGKDHHVIMVVDNLQSGPEAGKGIAETLKVPHVVLTNFPSGKGYLATLEENVEAIMGKGRQR